MSLLDISATTLQLFTSNVNSVSRLPKGLEFDLILLQAKTIAFLN